MYSTSIDIKNTKTKHTCKLMYFVEVILMLVINKCKYMNIKQK